MGLRNIFTGIRFNFSVPKYTDIAVNFTDGMFKGIYNGKQHHVSDIATVLSRAWNVDRIIVTGGSLEESKEALAIAETDGRLFCTVGVHPTRCKVVAIGECGLDYDRLHFCPPEVQKKYFEKQFELAYATKLPMFLHMRAAAEDFCEIMERNINKFTGGVTHSFTGSAEDRDKLLSFHNMYIGVNGCSLKMAENLDVVRGIPVERMMIETDSPYCEIKSTHAGINFVKSLWPSKKKEKYDKECLVKGRNEPCLVLVKATIERYKKASDSSNTGSVAEVNAQFYQQEADKLRNQIRNLQNTNRHMLGESVGGLPMKELKSLESRLEKGISRIRSKKNELLFAEIEYMQKKVKIVKCTVNDIPVDISFNQTAGLSALCFLEKVDQIIGKDHLFKRSIILIKAWCYYESRILGAHHGLISTYALETMILYIINVFHSSLFGPLAVLYKFLDYYSTFDWANYCISLTGPVLVSSLPAVVAESPENDGDELLLSRDFLNHCRVAYSGSMQPLEIGPNVFPVKYLNIIDPLKESNNLGRSVSKGSFHRIRCALSFGAQRLSEILMLPGENMGMALEKFFVNTLDRNGRGQRPDVQIPVHAFGTGKSEVCDLSGDYNSYYNGLLYSQWYHNYALNLPYHPTALSSSSSSQTHRYSAWDALRWLVRCKRNSYYRKGTNVFIPRPPYSHPSALQLPAATYGTTKSRGTGTFFPDMNHLSYRKMQANISSNPVLVQNPLKETDPTGDNGGNGDSHDLDLSTEQFPHLPTTERTMITHQSIPPAPKNPQAKNPSQCLPVLKFGNIYESSSPTDTYSPPPVLTESRLCVPPIEKPKGFSEFDRTITEPFQLKDNNDFPPLVTM